MFSDTILLKEHRFNELLVKYDLLYKKKYMAIMCQYTALKIKTDIKCYCGRSLRSNYQTWWRHFNCTKIHKDSFIRHMKKYKRDKRKEIKYSEPSFL